MSHHFGCSPGRPRQAKTADFVPRSAATPTAATITKIAKLRKITPDLPAPVVARTLLFGVRGATYGLSLGRADTSLFGAFDASGREGDDIESRLGNLTATVFARTVTRLANPFQSSIDLAERTLVRLHQR